MNSYFYRPNLKKFWIEVLENAIEHYEFEGNSEKYPDWKKSINEATTIEEINKIGNELRYEISLKGKRGGYWTALHMLSPFELNNLKETYPLDLAEAEKGIQKLESQNEELAHELQEEEEIVDTRNKRIVKAKEEIDNLKKEVAKWKTKYYGEKKRVIYHVLKLAEDQAEIKKLKESETKLEKTKRKLEQIIQEKEKQHAKIKDKKARLRERLSKQTSNLLRLKQKKNEVEKELNSELTQASKKNISLEKTKATYDKQRNIARNKLKTLKNKQQELKSVAESKRIPLSLIKSENITNSLLSESDNSLLSAIENTNNSLIDTVAKTQQYLKVDDLTLIATSHPLPEGKSLADLINFYNNPPLCQNPQHVNYNTPSTKSDH